jgi:hypothetical protein
MRRERAPLVLRNGIEEVFEIRRRSARALLPAEPTAT